MVCSLLSCCYLPSLTKTSGSNNHKIWHNSIFFYLHKPRRNCTHISPLSNQLSKNSLHLVTLKVVMPEIVTLLSIIRLFKIWSNPMKLPHHNICHQMSIPSMKLFKIIKYSQNLILRKNLHIQILILYLLKKVIH